MKGFRGGGLLASKYYITYLDSTDFAQYVNIIASLGNPENGNGHSIKHPTSYVELWQVF